MTHLDVRTRRHLPGPVAGRLTAHAELVPVRPACLKLGLVILLLESGRPTTSVNGNISTLVTCRKVTIAVSSLLRTRRVGSEYFHWIGRALAEALI